jgi:DNA primase
VAISDDDIERVRGAQPISSVIGNYVALKRAGRNFLGLCPFHGEKTPSFNVRDETGRYKCFGCGASGDVFKFVQEVERLDFVGAIEHLAAKSGITITYTTGGPSRDRQRNKQLFELMQQAVEWYHQRLLTSPDAKDAREYLRTRGLSGDIARQFKLGWAPDAWDALATDLSADAEMLRDCGLAFTNSRGRLQDSFRARVMFPIFKDSGEAVAFGGRVLPGSKDPAKYKNSSESKIYTKSKTLYGLNWAKADVVKADQIVVCEGYTDVIGFHRVGFTRVVATCGTALTEDHVRLMKRFANNVVLAFDADAAGQGAAERFYEWERKIDVRVNVARLKGGKDPGDLADSDPQGLLSSVENAEPFMAFRVRRVLDGAKIATPEDKARVAERAIAIINEHPNVIVRRDYATQVAEQLWGNDKKQIDDIVQKVDRKFEASRSRNEAQSMAQASNKENAEFVILALMIARFDEVTGIVAEEVFGDDTHRRVFRALMAHRGNHKQAEADLDPDALELLSRVEVFDVPTDADPRKEGINLLRAAVRRELARRVSDTSSAVITRDREIKQKVEQLSGRDVADSLISDLLAWLYDVTSVIEA